MLNKNGFENIIKQAQKMQEKMAKIQKEISLIEVTGESGAGLVKVTINGHHNCKNIEIDSTLIKKNNKELLEDLIIAAFNDSMRRITDEQKKRMTNVSSELMVPVPKNYDAS